MKIKDIHNFIQKIMIFESTSLFQIRKSVLGKGNPIRIGKEEIDWFEKTQNKERFIKLLNKILDSDSKNELKSLQSFDTDDYFVMDEETKKRCLKPQSLFNILSSKIDAIKERKIYTNNKSDKSIEAQYQKLSLKNGIELYAVYTPLANQQLTHKILKTKTVPTWCIASSTANTFWSSYDLYNAEYPTVFIVARKLKSGEYEDTKYELKCNPKKTVDFKNGLISLKDFVDEWRNPNQRESNFFNTSLFKNFGIDKDYLEKAIRKLMNSNKAKSFSKKYGKQMRTKFNKKISNTKNEKEKRQYLIRACQNGTFIDYIQLVKTLEEKRFYIERLKEYDGLFEFHFTRMGIKPSISDLNNLIKTKRCTSTSLQWAKNGNEFSSEEERKKFMLKILTSIDDDVLNWYCVGLFGDNKKEATNLLIEKGKINPEIYKRIKEIYNDKNRGKIYRSVIKHNKMTNDILRDMLMCYQVDNYYIEDEENKTTLEMIEDAFDAMIKSNTISSHTLDTISHFDLTRKNKKYFDIVIDFLIDDDKCDQDLISTIKEIQKKVKEYHQNDYIAPLYFIKNRLEDIIKNLIKNEKIDDKITTFVLDMKIESMYIPVLKELIESNKYKSPDDLLIKCLKRDKTDISTNYVFKWCVKKDFLSVYILKSLAKYKKVDLIKQFIKYYPLKWMPRLGHMLDIIADFDSGSLFKYALETSFKHSKNINLKVDHPHFSSIKNKKCFDIFMKFILTKYGSLITPDYFVDYVYHDDASMDNFKDYIPGIINAMKTNDNLDGSVLCTLFDAKMDEELMKDVLDILLKNKKYDHRLLLFVSHVYFKTNMDLGITEQVINDCIEGALKKAKFNYQKNEISAILNKYGMKEKLEELEMKFS